MKKSVSILVGIICVAMCSQVQAQTSGTCGEHLQWNFDYSDSTLVITGNGAMNDYTASSVDGSPWVKLPIMHISLPEGLTRIGKHAFCYCKKVKELHIPNSVTEISEGAMNSMSGLKKLTLGASLRVVGENAVAALNVDTLISLATFDQWCRTDFNKNGGLIRVNNALIIEGQQVTGDFYLPSTVHRINDNVFYYCPGMTAFHIPNSVDTIGKVFGTKSECSTYYYEGTVAEWCAMVHTDGLRFVQHTLYINGDDLTDVVLPDNIEKVPEHLFHGVVNLKKVTIPQSVRVIGESAFSGTGLTEVSGGANVRRYEKDCFEGSKQLRKITIPRETEYVGDYAFWVIDSLRGTLRLDSILYLGESAFSTTGLDSVFLPDHLTSIGDNLFRDCSHLRYVQLPAALTAVPATCFWGTPSLHAITIPEPVRSIGYSAFYKSGIEELTLPAQVDSLASGALSTSALQRLTVLNPVPPVATDNPFCNCFQIPVEVPCEAVGVYRNTEGWKQFTNYVIPQIGSGNFTTNNANWGTVSIEQNCEQITLTATPKEHYHFAHWSNGETANPYSFEQSGDTAITAVFEIDQFRIAYLNCDSSVIRVDSVIYNTLPVYTGPVPVHPTDPERYRFYGWSHSLTRATKDTSYVAVYSDLTIHYEGLCLHAIESTAFYWNTRSYFYTGSTLQVSRDGQHWETMGSIFPRVIAAGDSLFLRSQNASIFNGIFYTQGGVLHATGSVMSLLDTALIRTDVPAHAFVQLFKNCKNLYSAPYLPATNLGDGCYDEMFSGCDSLRYVEVAFSSWTNANGNTFTNNWLSSVAPMGQFVIHDTLPLLTDASHIPSGWIPYFNDSPLTDSTYVYMLDNAAYIYWPTVDSADLYLLTRYADSVEIGREWIDTHGLSVETDIPATASAPYRTAQKVVLQQSEETPSTLAVRYYWDGLVSGTSYQYSVAAYQGAKLLAVHHGNFVLPEHTSTAIDGITEGQLPVANKTIRNGLLIIMIGDKEYSITGHQIK